MPQASNSRRNSVAGVIARPAPSRTTQGNAVALVASTLPTQATTSPVTSRSSITAA
ncbi:hypothetical protein SMALA_1496 [Streptomyces malaysiensis subsp. malaysiensis]|nr:hypothetical protein SMALA_1496 [Streptomyces malaysiensis]